MDPMATVNIITHKHNVLYGLQQSEKYSDLRLVTECGQSLMCHKLVIAAISSKISASLDKNSDIHELNIRNVKYNGLQSVISLIYNGKVEILNKDNLDDFVACYTLLGIKLGPKIGDLVRKLSVDINNENDAQTSTESYHCANCDKHFVIKAKYQRHVREVHRTGGIDKPKKVYTCESCGKCYKTQRQVLYCECKTKKRRNKMKENEKDPWNRCRYSCAVCAKEYDDRNTIRCHINYQHQMEFQDYISAFGDPVISNPKWNCQVCHSKLKFERKSVEKHLVHHKLSIDDYEESYGRPENHQELFEATSTKTNPRAVPSTENLETSSSKPVTVTHSGAEPPPPTPGNCSGSHFRSQYQGWDSSGQPMPEEQIRAANEQLKMGSWQHHGDYSRSEGNQPGVGLVPGYRSSCSQFPPYPGQQHFQPGRDLSSISQPNPPSHQPKLSRSIFDLSPEKSSRPQKPPPPSVTVLDPVPNPNKYHNIQESSWTGNIVASKSQVPPEPVTPFRPPILRAYTYLPPPTARMIPGGHTTSLRRSVFSDSEDSPELENHPSSNEMI